jgi:class 3 adenylate cyclase
MDATKPLTPTLGDRHTRSVEGIVARRFEEPDETVTFDHGRVDLVRVGALAIGYEILEPGWRWSVHIKPIVETEWCEFHHVGYLLGGRIGLVTSAGETAELEAGDLVDVAPGHDAWVIGDEPAITINFQGVVGWAIPPEAGERLLTTILFSDVVSSTETAERLGDSAWRRLLASHFEDVRLQLERHRGREVNTTGDGVLATFDSPANAVMCGMAIARSAETLGISVRVGVHTGEVEIAEGDPRGVAVHLAARIVAAAAPGAVFVSATSRELAGAAAIDYVDRGMFEFKGISGPRQLFEARPR